MFHFSTFLLYPEGIFVPEVELRAARRAIVLHCLVGVAEEGLLRVGPVAFEQVELPIEHTWAPCFRNMNPIYILIPELCTVPRGT